MGHGILAGDTGALWDWMNSDDSIHDSLRMSRAYQKGGYELLAKVMVRLPILGDWSEEQLLDSLGDMEAQDLLSAHFGMTESKKSISKKTLSRLIAEAVKKGLANAIKERNASRVTKISSAQLAEGIRKAVKKVLSENAGLPVPEPKDLEAGRNKSKGFSTFGKLPSSEELQQAIDDLGGWDMELKGSDAEAFDVAMNTAGINTHKAISLMQSGNGMHKVLSALMNLGNEPIEDLEDGSEIVQNAESLAASIMSVLGWEWL